MKNLAEVMLETNGMGFSYILLIESALILLGLIMLIFPDILAKRALAGRRMITVTPNKLHEVIGLNKTRWFVRIIGVVLLGIGIFSILS